MGFIGTTAAVALGGALIPFAGFVIRVFGLLILIALVLAYCSNDDGHPAHAVQCIDEVKVVPGGPPIMWYCRVWDAPNER